MGLLLKGTSVEEEERCPLQPSPGIQPLTFFLAHRPPSSSCCGECEQHLCEAKSTLTQINIQTWREWQCWEMSTSWFFTADSEKLHYCDHVRTGVVERTGRHTPETYFLTSWLFLLLSDKERLSVVAEHRDNIWRNVTKCMWTLMSTNFKMNISMSGYTVLYISFHPLFLCFFALSQTFLFIFIPSFHFFLVLSFLFPLSRGVDVCFLFISGGKWQLTRFESETALREKSSIRCYLCVYVCVCMRVCRNVKRFFRRLRERACAKWGEMSDTRRNFRSNHI